MAKIRAYKLAEELGIERLEFVEKAKDLGIELRSPMASLDDAQIEMLRGKLGGTVTEERVEKRSAGGAVIRRRRRKVVEAPPEEAPAPAPVLAEAPAEGSAEAAQPAAEAEPVAAPAEPIAEEAEAPTHAEPEAPVAQPIAAKAPTEERVVGTPTRGPVAPGNRPAQVETPQRGAAARRAQPVRRTHNEQVKLKEQEGLARTMMGNVQHRLEQRRSIVEQQSREQRRRRGAGKKLPPRPAGPQKKKVIRVRSDATFTDLAAQTGLKVRDLLRRARTLGAEVDRDDRVSMETIQLLAEEIGYQVQQTAKDVEEAVASAGQANADDLEPRPPVVTVMGHVDHGKTSLLDTIRKANVVAGESGGITQHIGAYKVVTDDGAEIAFLDTPGHAAFTQMRARGAQATDVVVLVVAADDGIMPQTVEAIDHARAAEVPIIVAINKIDRAESDPQRVKQALLEHELVPEDFGGDVICVEVSATKGTNIDKLLEMLALQTEILELRARTKGAARGVVVEAELDRGQGPVATILVQEGTLKRGDAFVVGEVSGRVRTLTNEHGQTLKEAGPSTPVQIVGLSGVPDSGLEFVVVKNEREAKEIAGHRQAEERRQASQAAVGPDLETAFANLGADDTLELAVVIKADVRGTMEAICEASEKLSTDRVTLRVLHAGVGAINESDIDLAEVSNARVYGFHVRPEPAARKASERAGVDVRTFDVVYELLDDVHAMMTGLLPPRAVEAISGHAEVRELFKIPKRGTIAGCAVADGVVRRGDLVRVLRNGVPIYSGPMESLRHHKDDVREVRSGTECGIRVENYDDYKVGDLLESYVIEEHPDTL